MNRPCPTKSELANAIAVATDATVRELFAEFPDHHFYYITLITPGEVLAPAFAAWSYEALEEAVAHEPNKEETRVMLKWSYADSPFFCYGEEHFAEVRRLFDARPNIELEDDEDYCGSACEAEALLRLDAMESAMSSLDQQGLFGVGEERFAVVVNVELAPPDYSNTERAMRLNPPEAIREWLVEAAEDEED